MEDENRFHPALDEEAQAQVQPAAQAQPPVVAVVQHNHQTVRMFDGTDAINFILAFKNFASHQ